MYIAESLGLGLMARDFGLLLVGIHMCDNDQIHVPDTEEAELLSAGLTDANLLLKCDVINQYPAVFNEGVGLLMAHHHGQAITEYHVASLVNGAYQKAANVASAINGFQPSGINSFDRDVFSEMDFSGALTT